MDRFFKDLVTRLFERETLVVIAAFFLLYTGRITTVEEAVALASTVVSLIAGRSLVKSQGQSASQLLLSPARRGKSS